MANHSFSVLSSATTRRMVLIASLALGSLLVILYGLLFFYSQQQHQKAMEVFLSDIASRLNHKIDHHETNLHQITILPADEIQGYQLLIFTPDNQIIPIQNHHFSENQNLAAWKFNTPNHRQVAQSFDGFEAWYPLHNQYRLYVKVKFSFILSDFNNPLYLLPLLWTVCLLWLISIQLRKRQENWQELTQYLHLLPQNIMSGYRPLHVRNSHYQPVILHLSQLINRLAYKMNHYYEQYNELLYRQNALIDNAPIALFLISRKGKLLYFNEKFSQLFATPFDKNIIYMLNDFLTGMDKETQQLLNNLQEYQALSNLSVTNLQHDNYFELSLMPFYNRFGQLKGYSGGLQVVTHFHDKLQQAWLDDKHYNEKIASFDKLWAVLGHELRTPLSGMIGMIDLLNEDKNQLNQEQQDTLNTLQQSSQTMLQLLNDMLDMAKMDAGKLQSNITSVNLLALLRQVSDLMIGNARRNHISLYIFADPLVPNYFDSDDGRLRQILLNLMSNAVKFTKQGYVALLVDKITSDHPIIQQKLAMKTSEIPVHWLRLIVKDTGIGILPKDQKKLFSYFNQANDSISSQFGGTGLGLAISNNFSQMLGGFIHLESQAGQGSEFQVYLPLNKFSLQSAFDYRIKHLKVFLIIICPYPIMRLFERFLKYYDLAGMVITNIDETMADKINSLKFLDLMPVFIVDDVGYVGNEALFDKIPIFNSSHKILSSIQSEHTISSDILMNFDGFLPKPVTISGMLAEISRLYHRNMSSAQSFNTLPAQVAFRQFLQQNNISSDSPIPSVGIFEQSQQDSFVNNPHPNLPSLPTKNIVLPDIQKKVLLAEDNPVNQKIAQKLLKNLGYDTFVANNGEEAITILTQQREEVGLILMDCRMPILDGIEATRIIRSQKDSVPIIALTANDTDDDRQVCIEAGMNNFITKPINRDKLSSLLKRYWI